jgi:hypothetical protein
VAFVFFPWISKQLEQPIELVTLSQGLRNRIWAQPTPIKRRRQGFSSLCPQITQNDADQNERIQVLTTKLLAHHNLRSSA